MAHATHTDLGTVVSLWRYPVKSMLGEELHTAQMRDHGLLGDRAYALLDSADGKVATAKNPRKWPHLFAFRSAYIEPLGSAQMPGVRITLPDGTSMTDEDSEINQVLSQALNRQVTLVATARGSVAVSTPASEPVSWTVQAEEYWPDIDGLDYRDTVTDFTLPTGTFFDCATVHLLTTATLNRLQECYPHGHFEVQRFRLNIVVEPVDSTSSVAEQAWIGQTLAIRDEVRLHITGPCGRCVMTTLAQGELPQDPGILRTAVQQSQGHVGVYAAVVRGGTLRRSDRVRLVA